ncbi:MAG TPA: SCO family protein [Burkholderiaceae bacterium]|nr:SCO family protein [Burkholderiaceae bacterium]
MRRRAFLGALGATVIGSAGAHDTMGPVDPPVAAPDLMLVDHLGQPRRLPSWLRGHTTLVQLIFTGCSSVCPIQGALFAEVQRRIEAQPSPGSVHLLSISIDTQGDTPQALAQWLGRMGARQPDWSAAVPSSTALEALQASLRGRASSANGLDAHSESVFFFDEQARLRWRSSALPTVDEVMRVLRNMAFRSTRS